MAILVAAKQPGADVQGRSLLSTEGFQCDSTGIRGMAPDEMGLDEAKNSSRRAIVAYLCHFRPEPEGGFTVTCPKLPPVVTYGETLEEAQANAREAIELCLEVMREDGRAIPPPDRDLVSPIDPGAGPLR